MTKVLPIAAVVAQGHGAARVKTGFVILLGALAAFAPLSIDIYLPCLPAIARSFGVSTAAAQATLAAFLAGLAIGQFLYGPASDRWGRRVPILVGVVLYVAASALCALSTSLEMLIVARFFQALGGSGGAVIVRAIVRDRFGHRDCAHVLSMLMLVTGLAPIVAPLIGSALLTFAGWRANFWLVTVIGAVVLGSALIWLEESRSPETAAYAQSEHPLRSYLALLREPRLVGFILAGALSAGSLFAYIAAGPGLLIGTYGLPAAAFGLYFSVNALALVALSQWNRVMLRRRTPEQIVALVRPITLAVAAILVWDAYTGLGGIWGVLVPLFCIVGSFGLITANTMAGGLNVDPRRAGSISALIGGAQFGFGALASASVGMVPGAGAQPLAATELVCIGGSALALHGLALRRRPRSVG